LKRYLINKQISGYRISAADSPPPPPPAPSADGLADGGFGGQAAVRLLT